MENEQKNSEQDFNQLEDENHELEDIRINYKNKEEIVIKEDEILASFYSFLLQQDGRLVTIDGSSGNNIYRLMQFGRLINISNLGDIMYSSGLHVINEHNMISTSEDDENVYEQGEYEQSSE